jgi:hypothetical protein
MRNLAPQSMHLAVPGIIFTTSSVPAYFVPSRTASQQSYRNFGTAPESSPNLDGHGLKMDGVELALGGAHAAAHAHVLVHLHGAAAQAALGLLLQLLLGEGAAQVPKLRLALAAL